MYTVIYIYKLDTLQLREIIMCLKEVFMAILCSILILVVSYGFGSLVYHPGPLDKQVYSATPITNDDSTPATAPASIEAEEISTYLENADLTRGKKLFKKCLTCHTIKKGGKAKTGPNLFAVVGRPKANAIFGYSEAMRAKGGVWSVQELSEFLTKPKAFIKGTRMSFIGLSKVKDRADVIAYIKTFKE